MGKGQAAEAFHLPGVVCWDVGEYPPDCHIMWSAIMFRLWYFCGREYGVISMVHGFSFAKKRKEMRK